MNAVIALCHFCEAHGPCEIFCTQTLRDTKLDELNFDQQQISNKLCSACNSLGQSNAIYSVDSESGATFLSTQVPVLPEVATLIKQASVRSLSCEINANKDGGFVFFGDSSRAHVLSHTFHVPDLQARGFYQLFSIIILMKDKFFLLNVKPFLSEHLTRISSEIKNSAKKIYDAEEARGSPRQRRLSGSHILVQTPRSLVDLTGEANIYAIIHSHFSWLLLASARTLTEHVTFGNLPWLPTNNGIEFIRLTNRSVDETSDEEQEEFYSLRHVKDILGEEEFNAACFCALTGIKIIIRGAPAQTAVLTSCLRKLLPEPMHVVIRQNAPQFLTNSECKIVSVSPEIAVPVPSSSVYRVDLMDNVALANVKWLGEVPSKWPDLMSKLVKAVNEPLFTDFVLNSRTKVLVEEWKNKVSCIQRAKSSTGINKLRKVLGIQTQDQPLVNYWKAYL